MSSITKKELIEFLEPYPDEAEVLMFIRHRYDISKESGERGWYAYINGIRYDDLFNEIELMN